ncbi:hypothetical protein ADK75_06335 [Streptomyces virginiae]|uniref:Uncharacterized protein n=1 Tax=Streptomyces virginiae TaxID=1961 RepID=A0A0L8N2F2_STRVG|nr:SDR family oxidoreductase [Streptomyces virginiae]KOG56859.1 hypothetical protein ADK75_06335 [Streptomyces virginiae]
MRFRNKIAVVTGAGKGIGRAIAVQLARGGATVFINYFHSPEAARSAKDECERVGATAVHLVRGSVAKDEQVEAMFAEIERLTDGAGIDLLFNNAAAGALSPLDDLTSANWARAFDTNLFGTLRCSQRAAPMMARRGGGAIVNLSSVGAGMVFSNYAAVGSSKAAVESLTRYLAVEYARHKIRVNTASGSLIEGDAARRFPEADGLRDVIVGATPLGRLGTAEDLANVALFLASDEAGWVTGQTLLADGGHCLGSAIMSPPAVIAAEMQRLETGRPSQQALTSAVEDVASPATQPHAPTVIQDDVSCDSIAIVGMGLAVPGANTADEFWERRLRGDALFSAPGDRWNLDSFYAPDPAAEDRTYSRKSGHITEFPQAWKQEPESEAYADGTATPDEYTLRWMRHSLAQALKGVTRNPNDNQALIIGYTADGSQHLEESLVAASLSTRLLRDVPAGQREGVEALVQSLIRDQLPHAAKHVMLPHEIAARTAKDLMPDDTNTTIVDTACSSSLYAIDIGVKQLLGGSTDIAVCGGALATGPRGSALFSKLSGLSRSDQVRSLDENSDGVLFSDGAGFIVLKRTSRAIADGDTILGYVAGIGTSSDGRGKAIYAPSSQGQQIAVQRAHAAAGPPAQDVSWIVAHATGTREGDLAEFQSLRAVYGDRPAWVTSNKSVFGHTGWAAGVVSVIEVLLGFRHQLIPQQANFKAPQPGFELNATQLAIPVTAQPWKSNGKARAAGVSGFGFGGTNAHMVLTERPATAAPKRRPGPSRERTAIVAWGTCLPGQLAPDDVAQWLRGAQTGPVPTFGDTYPLPPLGEIRIPPKTQRTIDRAQMMVLQSVFQIQRTLEAFWNASTETTSVFVGHMGPTRNATLYASRCYLNHLGKGVAANQAWSDSPDAVKAFARFSDEIRTLVPPGNEDSYPGLMPNVISARVSNYFNLRGPSMVLDTGFTSAFSALTMAQHYLDAGDTSLALVCGMNGNGTPELLNILDSASAGIYDLAEGAFTLALCRESTARSHSLEVLGWLDTDPAPDSRQDVVIHAGEDVAAHYLAAEGTKAVIQALGSSAGSVRVSCTDPVTGHHADVVIEQNATTLTSDDAGAQASRPVSSPTQTDLGTAPTDRVVDRYAIVLEEQPLKATKPVVPAVSADTIVITDSPVVAKHLAARTDALVICTVAAPGPALFNCLAQPSREHLDGLVRAAAVTPHHLRVISRLPAPSAALGEGLDALLALHDVAFLALQVMHDTINQDGSASALLLDAVHQGVPHPCAGMFTGLFKAAAMEMPERPCFTVMTDSTELDLGLALLERESTAQHTIPVVAYQSSTRLALTARPQDSVPAQGLPLNCESVVVAAGGTRGITAESLVALADAIQPNIWVLGSNSLDQYPPETYIGADQDFDARRADFLRKKLQEPTPVPLPQANQQFERMRQARQAHRNLQRLRARCGNERVHYLQCDLTNPQAVQEAIDTIYTQSGRIDLLLNSAGYNRPASIPNKELQQFRAVRDVKVRSYANLKQALKGRTVRMWCNFGSLIGLTGYIGETDYASANDFLNTAAMAMHAQGQDEFTIGWTRWASVGLAAGGLQQAFIDRTAGITKMSTAEGVRHFLAELATKRSTPTLAHLGNGERAILGPLIPSEPEEKGSPFTLRPLPTRGTFFLTNQISRGADHAVWERTFTADQDDYLSEHLVRGVPTLPGSFFAEIAAEAASAVHPGYGVHALSELSFDAFLRLFPGRPDPRLRITARTITKSATEIIVEVLAMSDTRAPNGTLLVRDRQHFKGLVHLSTQPAGSPSWDPWPTAVETPVPDPFYLANPAIHLTGTFVSTHATRHHPKGARATYALPADRLNPRLETFILPALLIDGLLRTTVLSSSWDNALSAPVAIDRIDVYTPCNDAELMQNHPQGLELYCSALHPSQPERPTESQLVAVTPSGRTALEISGLRGTPVRRSEQKSFARMALT